LAGVVHECVPDGTCAFELFEAESGIAGHGKRVAYRGRGS
jgi:hypothetical protein